MCIYFHVYMFYSWCHPQFKSSARFVPSTSLRIYHFSLLLQESFIYSCRKWGEGAGGDIVGLELSAAKGRDFDRHMGRSFLCEGSSKQSQSQWWVGETDHKEPESDANVYGSCRWLSQRHINCFSPGRGQLPHILEEEVVRLSELSVWEQMDYVGYKSWGHELGWHWLQ